MAWDRARGHARARSRGPGCAHDLRRPPRAARDRPQPSATSRPSPTCRSPAPARSRMGLHAQLARRSRTGARRWSGMRAPPGSTSAWSSVDRVADDRSGGRGGAARRASRPCRPARGDGAGPVGPAADPALPSACAAAPRWRGPGGSRSLPRRYSAASRLRFPRPRCQPATCEPRLRSRCGLHSPTTTSRAGRHYGRPRPSATKPSAARPAATTPWSATRPALRRPPCRAAAAAPPNGAARRPRTRAAARSRRSARSSSASCSASSSGKLPALAEVRGPSSCSAEPCAVASCAAPEPAREAVPRRRPSAARDRDDRSRRSRATPRSTACCARTSSRSSS